MRYKEILHERTATKYLYHGTTIDRLDSILKHGLLPNGNKPYSGIKNKDTLRKLGKNSVEGNYDSVEWESLHGVYVTDSINVALNAANHVDPFDEPIIVVISTSLQSTLPDEDLINILMESAYMTECNNWGTFEDEYGLKAHLEDYWDGEDGQDEWARFKERVIKRFHSLASKDHPNISFDHDLLIEAFDYWYELRFEGGIGDLSSRTWYQVKDEISRKYRQMENIYHKEISRRITKPVSFSGRNRIVAVLGTRPFRYLYGNLPADIEKSLKEKL